MAISAVSGTLTQGSSVTITGTSFGTKSTAAPLKYEDFQSITVGSQIPTSTAPGPAWHNGVDNIGVLPVVATTLLRSGTPYTRNMQCAWTSALVDANRGSSNVFLDGLSLTKFVLDCWFYADTSGTAGGRPGNSKPFRFHNTNAGNPNLYIGTTDPTASNTNSWAVARDGTTDGGVPTFMSSGGGPLHDVWVHFQFIVDLGSGNGALDSTAIARINDVAYFSHIGDLGLTATGFYAFPEFWLGNYLNNNTPGGGWSGTWYQYWESVYLDSTWARVEIGNNVTYASCTHREVWIPSAWSATSVTATLNRGSFGATDSVWLFVVDSANVASAGFPIQLGAAGAPNTAKLVFGR